MRAIYLEDITSEEIEVIDEKFHHLQRVIRVRQGDEVLLLDGKGSQALSVVEQINKKSIVLKRSEILKINKHTTGIILGVCQVKKDALDLILKQAVELGVHKIQVLKSCYSQEFSINSERALKLMISACEQSNNPFLPVLEYLSLEEFVSEHKNIVYFSSITQRVDELNFDSDIAILIGPEAGLSIEEEKFVIASRNIAAFHLPSYILRAPTAVACACGVVFGRASLK